MYASLYVRLLSKLSRNDTLQFVLVLIGDMIAGKYTRRTRRTNPSMHADELPSYGIDRDDRLPLFLSGQESPYPPLLKSVARDSAPPDHASRR